MTKVQRHSAPVIRPAQPYPLPVTVPVVVERPASSCNCASGSGFEQKIKENPMIFVLGALLVGYLLAKN